MWEPKSRQVRHDQRHQRSIAASYAAVIASALKLYEALIDDAEKGGELFLKTADGVEVKIKPIF